MLLRQAKRDAGFGRGGPRRDKILFRRDALGEQALLTTKVRLREGGTRASGLHLCFERRRFAALDNGERIAATDRLAEIAGQRDEPPAHRCRYHLHALRIAFDRCRKLDRTSLPADRWPRDLDPGVRDLLRGEDDGILWTFLGLAGLGTFGLLGSGLLAGFTAAAGPAASRKDEGQRHGRQRPHDVLRH